MRTHRPWILVACVLMLGTLVAIAAQGCGPQGQPSCPYNDGSGRYDPFCLQCAADGTIKGCSECIVDPELGPSFACSRDAGKDAATDSAITDGGATGCAGDCLPAPPFGWEGPGLFWAGTSPPPACPSNAPVLAYQGHDGLVLPDAGCAPCTCAAPSPAGSCAPPLQITVSASTCSAGAAPARDFGPPPAWDGTCTTFDPIPAGALCNGAPCAVSLTSGPLVLTEGACTPIGGVTVDAGPPSWSKALLACLGDYAATPCHELALTCAPSAAQAPGFLSCIFQKGDNDCPAPYLDKHLAYATFDPPGCTPCLCSAPDSSCAGTLSVFEDAGCPAGVKPLVALPVTAAGPECRDLLVAGVALGSKQLTRTYDAGSCAPSGGTAMDAGPSGASTFCCLLSA